MDRWGLTKVCEAHTGHWQRILLPHIYSMSVICNHLLTSSAIQTRAFANCSRGGLLLM
jgi:hypothetical protein